MNNRIKNILATLPLAISAMTGYAQSAKADLMHALWYSQQAAKAAYNGSNEAAYEFAIEAFQGGNGSPNTTTPTYYNKKRLVTAPSTPTQADGTPTTPTHSPKTSSTHHQQQHNQTSSQMRPNTIGGAPRVSSNGNYYARLQVERAMERARHIKEERQKLATRHLQQIRDAKGNQGEIFQAFIIANGEAKPMTEQQIEDFISNGVPGNVIIDEKRDVYIQPEKLLEGAGTTHETLEEKLKNMNEEEIEQFVKKLEEKNDNGEELTDEELDFLIAWEEEENARLEEEKRILEEKKRKLEEEIQKNLTDKTNKEIDKLMNMDIPNN